MKNKQSINNKNKQKMKAYKITSTEYKMNDASVFILTADGRFYGDTIYPRLRGWNADVEYWRTATCADADRFFTVEDVELSEAALAALDKASKRVEALNKCLLHDVEGPLVVNLDVLQRKARFDIQRKLTDINRAIYEANKPVTDEISALNENIMKKIKSLK